MANKFYKQLKSLIFALFISVFVCYIISFAASGAIDSTEWISPKKIAQDERNFYTEKYSLNLSGNEYADEFFSASVVKDRYYVLKISNVNNFADFRKRNSSDWIYVNYSADIFKILYPHLKYKPRSAGIVPDTGVFVTCYYDRNSVYISAYRNFTEF